MWLITDGLEGFFVGTRPRIRTELLLVHGSVILPAFFCPGPPSPTALGLAHSLSPPPSLFQLPRLWVRMQQDRPLDACTAREK